MTSPHVTELPRRLEPVARDPFLGGTEARAPRAVARAGNVVPLIAREAPGPRRPFAPRPPLAAA